MSLRLHLLLIVLVPVAVIGAIAASGAKLPIPEFGRDYVLRFLLPGGERETDLPEIIGSEDQEAPLVVIDAGHGGRDPGAVGSGISEKDLVLGLAIALRDALVEQGGIRVAMTREDDTLVPLFERPDIARRLGADLFISIHADSAGEKNEVSGASVYTLSNKASSEAAARFAARENDVDRLNGVEIEGQSEQVSAILVDLAQRRTQEVSNEFASLVTREGTDRLRFHPQPRRSAALAVLRAPDVPSVLYESGFVTNPDEAERLMSSEGRQRFAEVMARAIRIYFARQNPDLTTVS